MKHRQVVAIAIVFSCLGSPASAHAESKCGHLLRRLLLALGGNGPRASAPVTTKGIMELATRNHGIDFEAIHNVDSAAKAASYRNDPRIVYRAELDSDLENAKGTIVHEIVHQTTRARAIVHRQLRLFPENGYLLKHNQNPILSWGYASEYQVDELEARIRQLAIYRRQQLKKELPGGRSGRLRILMEERHTLRLARLFLEDQERAFQALVKSARENSIHIEAVHGGAIRVLPKDREFSVHVPGLEEMDESTRTSELLGLFELRARELERIRRHLDRHYP